MSGYPTNYETQTNMKIFSLCEIFGWGVLNDLGVPKKDRKKMIETFLLIIKKRNEDIEKANRSMEMKNIGRRY